MFRFLFLLFLPGLILVYPYSAGAQSISSAPDFQVGDLLFQSTQSRQSLAIRLATHSEFSHVGILIQENGDWAVLEAVQPVSITPLKEWIARDPEKHYVVKRLIEAETILTDQKKSELAEEGRKYLGWNYDLEFEWQDQEMYCSELVWKVYKNVLNIELGDLKPLGEYDLSNPIVKAKLTERYGKNLPLKEPMISPQSIFEAKSLRLIVAN
ncbi:MAG: YiiX family permuted papain-like enzyme [Bacteroidia bacterium]|nr:YiiX family permuted papain-like enzyme [Bacteroidia bacterium]